MEACMKAFERPDDNEYLRVIGAAGYRENPDTIIRWTDRLQSSSGEWSGNVFDFYFRVYNKMMKDIKAPFKMQGGFRMDDTPIHRAFREALANGMIKCFYV